jgi:hypothetical protein
MRISAQHHIQINRQSALRPSYPAV